MSTRIGGVAEVTESGLRLPICDYIGNAPTSTTDVLTFRLGGASGVVQCVVTIVYTDSSKGTLSTVTRTPPLL